MARLYIAEYANIAETVRGAAQAPLDPPLVEQTPVVIGGTSLLSATFNPATRFILITADAICSIAIGPAPVATTDNHRVPADGAQFRGVNGGDRLAVISNT